MQRGLWVALTVWGIVMAATGVARAERVALIRPDAQDPILADAFNRLKAELEIHHFDSAVVDTEVGNAPSEQLAEIAQKTDSLASIAFLHRGSTASVDVWLVDRVSGKTTMRRLEVGTTSNAASVLAIRAVDLLRVSLQEYEPGKRPPPDVVGVDRRPVPSAAQKLAAPPPPSVRLRAEGSAFYDGKALGLAYGPAFGVHAVAGRFEFGLIFAGPLVGARFTSDAGAATTRQELAWLDASFALFRAARFATHLSLGAGAHFLQAQGQPKPPLAARSDAVTSFAASVGASAEFELVRNAALSLGLRAFVLAPGAGVAITDQTTKLQQPLGEASLGVIVGL